MPRASALKRHGIVKIDDQIYQIIQIRTRTPSARGAATLYDIKYNNILTGQKLDKTYKGDDQVQDADLERTKVQFLYQDDDSYHFMKLDDYTQHILPESQIKHQTQWMFDGQEDIDGMFLDGLIIGINLPHTVELTIVETSPSMKGASATARTKPATLSTGAVVQVPEYIAQDEIIKVNTETGEFLSRA